jgi:glucokinase
VAGGTAPRIISRLQERVFLAAFNAEGVRTAAMQKMPLSVVKHDRLDLLGYALIADRTSRLVDRNPSMGSR